MALKVPTPAVPGGAQVGNVTTAPSANTPFQSFSVPNLGEDFGKVVETDSPLTQLAPGVSEGLQKLAQKAAQDQRDAENLDLITKQNYGDEALLAAVNEEQSLLGEHALGGTDRMTAALDTLENELRKETDNLTQAGQIALERYIHNLRTRGMSAVTAHEREQRHAFTIEQIDVSMSNAINTGVINYMDPQAMESSLLLLGQRARTRAEMTMEPGSQNAKDLAEKILRENASKLYSGAIGRALNEKSLGGATRAKELLAEAKATELLTPTALEALEESINISLMEEIARRDGLILLQNYPTDMKSARSSVEARTDIDGDTKDAIYDRYIMERALKVQAEDVAYAELLDAYLLMAHQDGVDAVSELELRLLRPADARAIRLEMVYAEGEKITGNRTDVNALKEWDAMGEPERGRLTNDEFLERFGNKFSNIDGRRDEAKKEWASAVEKVRGADVAAANLIAKNARDDDTRARADAKAYFDDLIMARKTAYWPNAHSDRDKAQRAAFVVAAQREFRQRNERGVLTSSGTRPPMTALEMEEIINTLSSRIVLDNTDFQVFDLMSDVRDADGRLVGNRKGRDVSEMLSAFEERDRFEIIQWYRRSTDIPANDPVEEAELDGFIFRELLITHDIPEKVLKEINQMLFDTGKAENVNNQQHLYRRFLIHREGG